MGILRIILWAVSIALVVADDTCPSASEISPCTCDGEGLSCMGDRTLEDVKRAFRGKFKYGSIRGVWIQGTTAIQSLSGNVFGNVKSQNFQIQVNNINNVDLEIFSASYPTLQTLSLFGNKLSKAPTAGLEKFENLGTYNLGRNQITSIPDSAFSSNSIGIIILAQNKISHIGMNAFSNLPNLNRIEMTSNELKTLGPLSFASRAHSASLQINLAQNHISSVSSTAFQGTSPYGISFFGNKLTSLPYDSFANLATRIGQKRGFIELSGNPLACTGCDYSWIVDNKYVLQNLLVGFTCSDGRSISHLTKNGINCPN